MPSRRVFSIAALRNLRESAKVGLGDMQAKLARLAAEQDRNTDRGEFSDEVMQNLGSLDNECFAYFHNLTDLLFAFVSKHPEEFGELPKADDE